jgi:hypothetical protein
MRRRRRCHGCGLLTDYPGDCACVPDLDGAQPDYGGVSDGVSAVYSDADPGL